jgi:uncharacterized protein
MTLTLEALRRHAIRRSLPALRSLPQVLAQQGFVQADPIRAPARAQDLMLRQRVKGYRAGDLERRYPRLAIEEDFFVNYGFVPRDIQRLFHPRTPRTVWPRARWKQAHAVLEYVREHGVVHPREVDAHFQHGKTRNWFGGSSNASTQLLDGMHYRGLLRIARRDGGVRLYAAREGHEAAPDPDAAMDRLVDVLLQVYAPLPRRSLSELVHHLRAAAPQWEDRRRSALQRACQRLPQAHVAGVDWLWPAGENPAARSHVVRDEVRLLAPFDPIVWDRRRFELFWGWAYRFEAYTPAPRRQRGYYALPLLWRDQVIGWGNLSVQQGRLHAELGYVSGKAPREAGYTQALDEELQRMTEFLELGCPE